MDLSNLFGKVDKKDDDPLHVKDAIEKKVEEIVTAPPNESEVKTLQDHMAKIEKDFDGISNIPRDHLYYDLRNRIHQLTQK